MKFTKRIDLTEEEVLTIERVIEMAKDFQRICSEQDCDKCPFCGCCPTQIDTPREFIKALTACC